MRLWSLHPKYLDVHGIIRVWRDALLARKIFEGRTRGYKRHPQLVRFRKTRKPLIAIDTYLYHISRDAKRRRIILARHKLNDPLMKVHIPITRGQLKDELKHLRRTLRLRNKRVIIRKGQRLMASPLFRTISGKIARWEKVSHRRKKRGKHSR